MARARPRLFAKVVCVAVGGRWVGTRLFETRKTVTSSPKTTASAIGDFRASLLEL